MDLEVTYKQQTATYLDVLNHLKHNDIYFTPILSKSVNISDYANKIVQFASTIEAWHNNELIGLIAIYLNDDKTPTAFITNVSVNQEHKQKGIANQLLLKSINLALQKNKKVIDLEVNVLNRIALNFYKKFNFVIKSTVADKTTMSKNLLTTNK